MKEPKLPTTRKPDFNPPGQGERLTYCQRQMAAVLSVCSQCGKSYYMVVPQPVCTACRRAK